jgi:hypothetical protein
VNAYTPNATMTNIAAMMIALAVENSFIVGVGEVEVLIGLNTG